MTSIQLESLKDLIAEYYQSWCRKNDQSGPGSSDPVLFLKQMQVEDTFWHDLEVWQSEQNTDLGLDEVRAALVSMGSGPGTQGVGEDGPVLLEALDLDPEEVAVLRDGMEAMVPRAVRIRTAFSAGSPGEIARALTDLLEKPGRATMRARLLDFFSSKRRRGVWLGPLLAASVLAGMAACGGPSGTNAPASPPKMDSSVQRQPGEGGGQKEDVSKKDVAGPQGDGAGAQRIEPSPPPAEPVEPDIRSSAVLYKGVSP